MGVEQIVNVTITRQGQSISQAGFGTPLILGTNATFSEHSREYTSLTAVAADFAPTSDEYKAAAAIFSQTPKPKKIRIGRRAANAAVVKTLTFSAAFVTSNKIDGVVNAVPLTQTLFATDSTTTLAALATKIAAVPGVASAVPAANTITVTSILGYPLDLADFVVSSGASQPTASYATTNAGVTAASELDALKIENNDWYGLILTSRAVEDVLAAAAWTQANGKVFVTASSDAAVLSTSTTDVAAKLQARAYDRTMLLYHQNPAEFPDAALMGRFLAVEPGLEIAKFLTLAGITVSALSDGQKANAWAKKANTYTVVGGVAILENGTMASGQFLDTTRNLDYLQARLQEAIYGRLVRQNKIPYSDTGVLIIVSEVQAVLSRMVREGVLNQFPEPSISYPKVADVSAQDRIDRVLPNISFSAREGNTIQSVLINGVVQV